MRRAALVLLLVSVVALLPLPVHADKAETQPSGEQDRVEDHVDEREHEPEREHDPEQDDDSDSAPFMIVVQHGNGRRCGGSLVSLRTALTSAWCVRGQHGGDPRELWALAPSVPPARPVARRVARVALAAGADSDSPPPHLEPAWVGAALDIAVLELEAPFGGDARSRPILMATRPEDCDMSTMCHVVRALGPAPRLRIVDAALVPGERCGAVARGWPGLRDSALCLSGPELCVTDRGAGVVCDGKLCGVLSRSARYINNTTDTAEVAISEVSVEKTPPDELCGDIHVAQSVARWRRFLHCAHTLRACGRGGECAKLCSERQLMVMKPDGGGGMAESGGALGGGGGDGDGGGGSGGGSTGGGGDGANDSGEVANGNGQNANDRASNARRAEPDNDAPDTDPPSTSPPDTTLPAYVSEKHTVIEISEDSSKERTRTSMRVSPTHTSRTTSPATVQTTTPDAPSSRPSFEFEPNRADFKGGPARTSRVYLKAGEYGDNAAEYGGEESVLSPSPTTTATTSSITTMDAGRVSELAAQQSAAVTTPRPRAQNCAPQTRLQLHFVFMSIMILHIF